MRPILAKLLRLAATPNAVRKLESSTTQGCRELVEGVEVLTHLWLHQAERPQCGAPGRQGARPVTRSRVDAR
jgi:hypothetical protein